MLQRARAERLASLEQREQAAVAALKDADGRSATLAAREQQYHKVRPQSARQLPQCTAGTARNLLEVKKTLAFVTSKVD
jgi:hypothetical protein